MLLLRKVYLLAWNIVVQYFRYTYSRQVVLKVVPGPAAVLSGNLLELQFCLVVTPTEQVV